MTNVVAVSVIAATLHGCQWTNNGKEQCCLEWTGSTSTIVLSFN